MSRSMTVPRITPAGACSAAVPLFCVESTLAINRRSLALSVSVKTLALRETAPDFIAFCLNPEMAAEATLQPMRRYPLSAAIVFADILLLPRALGQDVWFEAGEGPKLGPLPPIEALAAEVEASTGRMAAVGETLKLVRAKLEPERALIGFAGAPWTVATYMLERGSSDRQGDGGEDPECQK